MRYSRLKLGSNPVGDAITPRNLARDWSRRRRQMKWAIDGGIVVGLILIVAANRRRAN